MKIKWLYVFFILQSSLLASGDWTSKVYSEDKDFQYYVGISEGKKKLNEAYREAYYNALNEAVIHNYGVNLEYSSSILSDLDETQIQESSVLRNKNINIEGLTPFKEAVKNKDDSYIVYRQIRYSKSSIEKEKKRRSRKQEHLNQYGDSSLRSVLKLTTSPTDANVEIISLERNSKRYATTNCSVSLEHGKYLLVINKKGYQQVTRNVLIQGKVTQNIILKEATGRINLKVSPRNAIVKVNGKSIEDSNLKLKASFEHQIILSHPDYYSLLYPVSIGEGEVLNLDLKMRPRESRVMIRSKPTGAGVYIDDEYRGVTPILIRYDRESKLRIVKEKFVSFEGKLNFVPNRFMPEKSITLYKTPPYEEGNWIFNYNPIVIREGKGEFAHLPLRLDYKLFSYLWLYSEIEYTSNENDDGTTEDATRTESGVNLVIYKSQNGYANLGYGFLKEQKSHYYSDYQYDNEISSSQRSAQSYNFNMGMTMFQYGKRNKNAYLNIYIKRNEFRDFNEEEVKIGIGFEF
ncbi:PEGA domain-containing protein [Halobacteriovorax sp. DPLXC-1]|uniref:PEGA domain-containing protein n=1 Tax=Halobacteriovorax sp. DPLXC-1 TaxID=3110771 RepID=UPI002FF1EDD1